MNGVFNYNPNNYNPSGLFYSQASKRGNVSWSGVILAMAISLSIVAGLSFTLNILTQKMTHARMPDSDRLVYSWLAKGVTAPTAYAVAQYGEIDRSSYYNSNKDAYTGKDRTYFNIIKDNTPVAISTKSTLAAKSPTVSIASSSGSSMSATRLIQSTSSMSLAKKGTATFMIGFKNTGSTAWPSGVSLRSSATRGSYLSHDSWVSTTIANSSVPMAKPGELIYVTITIEAPTTTGTFKDVFYLSYGGKKIAGTDTNLSVIVVNGNPDTQISSKPAPSVSTVSTVIPSVSPMVSAQSSGTFDAIKLIQSATSLVMGQLQTTEFQIGWKNTGTAAWKTGEAPIRVRSSARTESYFRHTSWDDGVWVSTLKSDVQPGEVVYTSFKLEAPTAIGNYNETFTLYRGSTPLGSARVVLPVQVVKGAPKVQIAQENTPTLPTTPPSVSTIITTPASTSGTSIVNAVTESEPTIRVGVFNSREPIKITANKAFEARNAQGQVLASLAAGSVATVTFDFSQKTYTLATDSATSVSPTYIRFVGTGSPSSGLPDQDTVFEVVSYVDRPGWSSTLNDNRFRAALEVRYAESKDRVWVINELLLEHYLKGLAETSNNSPYEFQKSLIVAARTYAKIVMRTNKYPGENFHLRNTDADQVYRGYSSEIRMPNLAKAIAETRGVVVMYNGSIVVTPYFSNSDGRTRSWEEVWAGSAKPWLKSVEDPYCSGLTLWGHGVGMSARGAVSMAAAGKTFEQILTHYYTGIQLTRIH